MACARCGGKPERSTKLETRYALVEDVSEAENPEKIPASRKYDDPISAGRGRVNNPSLRVVVIKEYRRL